MEEEEMLYDDSSLYVSAVHKEALLRTDKYINHQNPHQDHYQGKEKVLMTHVPDKRLATGAPEVSIEGKLPHFDTGIVPVRRSPTSNLGDFLEKMQKY